MHMAGKCLGHLPKVSFSSPAFSNLSLPHLFSTLYTTYLHFYSVHYLVDLTQSMITLTSIPAPGLTTTYLTLESASMFKTLGCQVADQYPKPF
jgi:hypothetical protein